MIYSAEGRIPPGTVHAGVNLKGSITVNLIYYFTDQLQTFLQTH